MKENGLLTKQFYKEPLFIGVCILMLNAILLAFFRGYVSEIISIGTLVALVVTAIYIFKYWKETQRTNEITLRNIAYSRLPILDIERAGHNWATYYDDVINITNKGYGPAFDVSLQKISLPDNAQKKAVTGKTGPNNPFQKTYKIIAVGDTIEFYREEGYPAKEIKIVIRFMNMFKEKFEWEYKGAPEHLQLSRWHIDPATKKQERSSQSRADF